MEISALKLWGETGRWVVVTIIQFIKAVWRCFLLKRKNYEIIPSPPIKPLNRKLVSEFKLPVPVNAGHGFESMKQEATTFKLPHTGRVIRSLAGTLPLHRRTFCPPIPPNENNELKSKNIIEISKKQLVAEFLHIIRPVAHLSSIYIFGEKSWTPYFLSLFTDMTSLKLHEESALTSEEKTELTRRRINLLYYLIRSPLFQKVTHQQIKYFLYTVGNYVPLARSVCGPLLHYIPEWQKIYAYTWS